LNVKTEMKKAIGVLEARMEYLIKHEGFSGDFSEEEYNTLCGAISSLEKWLSDENIPVLEKPTSDKEGTTIELIELKKTLDEKKAIRRIARNMPLSPDFQVIIKRARAHKASCRTPSEP